MPFDRHLASHNSRNLPRSQRFHRNRLRRNNHQSGHSKNRFRRGSRHHRNLARRHHRLQSLIGSRNSQALSPERQRRQARRRSLSSSMARTEVASRAPAGRAEAQRHRLAARALHKTRLLPTTSRSKRNRWTERKMPLRRSSHRSRRRSCGCFNTCDRLVARSTILRWKMSTK